MTAPFAPPAPQQGPPTGPQGRYRGPQAQQAPFVQQQPQQQPQGASQGYWTNAPQRVFVLSPLNWLAIVLIPLGVLTVIIVTAADSYGTVEGIFLLVGIYAAAIGGLALVGGLIVAALKKNN